MRSVHAREHTGSLDRVGSIWAPEGTTGVLNCQLGLIHFIPKSRRSSLLINLGASRLFLCRIKLTCVTSTPMSRSVKFQTEVKIPKHVLRSLEILQYGPVAATGAHPTKN